MKSLFSAGSDPRRNATAMVCLAVLLAASSVQVMHHCSGLELGSARQAGSESLTSSPVFCNICMTVQVAAMAVVALVLAMGKVRSFAPALPVLFPPEATPAFSLYVRPPPVLSF